MDAGPVSDLELLLTAARRITTNRRRVLALELAPPCVPLRVRGRVQHVSATGALVTIAATAGTRHGRILEVPTNRVRGWGIADLHRPPDQWRRVQ